MARSALAAALTALPDLETGPERERLKATGTDHAMADAAGMRLAPCLARESTNQRACNNVQ